MNILPINNGNALQLNPNLGIILASDMEGWFYERYINIFMNGHVVDYVDNVNYAGVVGGQNCYSYDEVQQKGIIDIIEKELNLGNYMHIWVDEIALPCSIRYHRQHFVHPLMIYGYDSDNTICKSVFFDIRKGQVLIDINYQDLVESILLVRNNYQNGGTEEAVRKTLSSYKLSNCLKGTFHLDVFLRQLNNYLCCQSENGMEWYTLNRPGVFDSNANIFGIQIYQQIISFLESPRLRQYLNYKTLHDFVIHKKILLDRFHYIQRTFNTSRELDTLVNAFADNYKALERMRMLNIKKQVQSGGVPTSICLELEYVESLSNTLKQCYEMEMEILPQIYNCLIDVTYPHNVPNSDKVVSLMKTDGQEYNTFIEFDISIYNVYLSQIDIIRLGRPVEDRNYEFVVINNNLKLFLEKDSYDHIPIRTLKFPLQKIEKLRLYTDMSRYNYRINLFTLCSRERDETVAVSLDESLYGYHDIQRILSTNDMLQLKLIGEDPFIIKENISIDADKFSYLHIIMSSTAKTIYAQVYFSTIDNPYITEDKSLFFKVNPDGRPHSYYVRMSNNPLWSGIVQMLRLDPAQYHDIFDWKGEPEGVCNIEKFEFVQNKPHGEDDCQVAMGLREDGTTFA